MTNYQDKQPSVIWGNGFVILDLQLSDKLIVQNVPQLNAYVGDSGREVAFKLVNGRDGLGERKVYDLTGKYIALSVIDSAGKPKILEKFTRVNDLGGEFILNVPRAFYQEEGEIQEGIIDVFDDAAYTNSIGSVKISFETIHRELNIAIGEGASEAFHSTLVDLQKDINEFSEKINQKIDTETTSINDELTQWNNSVEDMNQKIELADQTLRQLINDAKVVDLTSHQKISGTKDFDEITVAKATIKELHGISDGINVAELNNVTIDFDKPTDLLDKVEKNQSKTFVLWKHQITNDPFRLSRIITGFSEKSIVVAEVVALQNTQSITLTNRDDGAKYQRWYYADGGVSTWRTIFYDSGYRDATPYLTDKFNAFSDGQTPKFRISGANITFVGAITPKIDMAFDADNMAFTTLPITFPWGASNLINSAGIGSALAFGKDNNLVITRQRNENGPLNFTPGQLINISGLSLPIE